MLKKTIQYQDLDGNTLSDDFYFHISMSEISKLELGTEGGMAEKLKKLVAASKGKDIIEQFEGILRMAYGVRSEDNKRFIKNEQVWNDFYQSDAYNVLFMQLISDPGASSEFVAGILPANFEQEVARITQNRPQDTPPVKQNVFEGQVPHASTELPYSAADIMSMTPEQFRQLQEERRSQG